MADYYVYVATEYAQDILGAFGGDIDCFAGDAVLVVFSPLVISMAAGTGDGGGDGMNLRESTRRAVECANVAIATLSNFQSTPEDPPLQVHCGVASGDLRSAICGAARLYVNAADAVDYDAGVNVIILHVYR